jgi:hypothetical protein
MSSRLKKIKAPAQPATCESCGLPFVNLRVLEMHYKYMENENVRLCLSPGSLRRLGFYRSRGTWRPGRKPS